jgi:predicted secreted hydrolase
MGNLDTADGRHLGYQLTFFRRGPVPPVERLERSSAWATGDVFMAHGERDSLPISGNGYVEMTGYAGSMQGQL